MLMKDFPIEILRGMDVRNLINLSCGSAEGMVNSAFKACETSDDIHNAVTFLTTFGGELLSKTIVTETMSRDASEVAMGKYNFANAQTREMVVHAEIDRITDTMKKVSSELLRQIADGTAVAEQIKLKG